MQITEQQFAALEQYHGQGMIIILTVGGEDFAFRRPNQDQVNHALEAQANDIDTYREELARLCVVSAAMPDAGAEGAPVTAEARAALTAEKERLDALWESAQSFRDEVSIPFAWSCGSSPQLDSTPLGGGRYKLTLTPNSSAAEFGVDWGPIEIVARKPSRPDYDDFKRKKITGAEGEAELLLWSRLVESANKADVARMFPFAAVATGNFLPTLGSDGRSVRVKKFGSGPALPPGSSTSTPAA
jgi:hypothetical protein